MNKLLTCHWCGITDSMVEKKGAKGTPEHESRIVCIDMLRHELESRPAEDALVGALDVWDAGVIESLYSLLTNRVGEHHESGNKIIEDGAYNILLSVIERQRQALADYRSK